MPASSLQIAGRRTYQPGAYGRVDGSGLAGRGPAGKTLVLVGEGVGGVPVSVLTDGIPTVTEVATVRLLKEQIRSGLLRDAGIAAFDVSKDPVVGTPGSIKLVKVNPDTQSTLTLTNVAGDALDLTSVDYGAHTNRIAVTVAPGTNQGQAVSIVLDDESEGGDDIGGDVAFTARYETGGDFDTATLSIDSTDAHIAFTMQLAADVVLAAFDAGEAATVFSSSTGDTVQSVTVYGTNASNVPISEVIALNGTTHVDGTTLFSKITGMRVNGATLGAISLRSADSGVTDVLTITATLTAAHTSGSAIQIVSSNSADVGQVVVVSGYSVGGVAISEALTLNGTTTVTGTKAFGKVTAAQFSEAAAGIVVIRTAGDGNISFTCAAGTLTKGIGLQAGIYIPNKAAFSGALQIKHTDTPSGTVFVVVRGRSTAGVVTAERLVITDSYATTTTLWASIDQIEIAAAEASNTIDVTGNAMSWPLTTSLKVMCDGIDAVNGFESSALLSGAGDFLLSQLDYAEASIRSANDVDFYADLDALLEWINGTSQIITAERSTGASGPPSTNASPLYLGGAADGTSTNADWQAAFDALKRERDIIVVVLSTSAAIHAMWRSHAAYMEGAGNNPRNGYVPLATSLTKAQIKAAITTINDRNTCAIAQSVDRYNEAGVRTTYGPEVLAALAGATQAATTVGEPSTRKLINAISLGQHTSWLPDDDSDEMIKAGLMFGVLNDEVGLRWMRSVTTYRTDDNPAFTEMSANESANTSVTRVVRQVDLQIGSKAYAGRSGVIKELVEAELSAQVRDGVIKDWRGVAVLDQGDVYPVEYELAPIEPLNFIPVTAFLTRIAA